MANLFKDGCDPWFDPAHPMNQREPWRPTIDELERLLASDDDVELEILPNGEVRAKGTGKKQGVPKVLTMRDNLGGEYAASSKSTEA